MEYLLDLSQRYSFTNLPLLLPALGLLDLWLLVSMHFDFTPFNVPKLSLTLRFIYASTWVLLTNLASCSSLFVLFLVLLLWG
jgi:hypothetical protein